MLVRGSTLDKNHNPI